jgi:hypothetical protein
MTTDSHLRRLDCPPPTSGLPQQADIFSTRRHVSKLPIVLKKSFWDDDQNFLGLLMRFTRGDARDHIVSFKIDHGPSLWR